MFLLLSLDFSTWEREYRLISWYKCSYGVTVGKDIEWKVNQLLPVSTPHTPLTGGGYSHFLVYLSNIHKLSNMFSSLLLLIGEAYVPTKRKQASAHTRPPFRVGEVDRPSSVSENPTWLKVCLLARFLPLDFVSSVWSTGHAGPEWAQIMTLSTGGHLHHFHGSVVLFI